jgi:site-specific DNA-methyltransferase (adenine-specific)
VGGLHELRSYGEPGAMVYLTDCVERMRLMPAAYVDVVFADPPYLLSGGGVTVKSGRVTSVDKGDWDRSLGSFEKDQEWNVRWLREAWRVLKPNGTLWVSSTHHVIFSPGFALQILGSESSTTFARSTNSGPLGFRVRVSANGEREDDILSERLRLATI